MKILITGGARVRDNLGRFKRTATLWTPRKWNTGHVKKDRFWVYLPQCPRSRPSDGWVQRSHAVWWKHTGTGVPYGYCLHHRDGNKLNDAIENLQLMRHGAHTILHCKKKGIECMCKNCLKLFFIPKWRLKDPNRGKFCSQKCYREYHHQSFICLYCGEVHYTTKCAAKNRKFCNKSHAALYNRNRTGGTLCTC